VLTKVARQVLDFLAELKKFVTAMIRKVEACIFELARERIV
jgi:hypothetical protein